MNMLTHLGAGIIPHCIPVSDDHVVHLTYTLSWVNCISKKLEKIKVLPHEIYCTIIDIE